MEKLVSFPEERRKKRPVRPSHLQRVRKMGRKMEGKMTRFKCPEGMEMERWTRRTQIGQKAILDRANMSNRIPGSQPRSPFTRSVSYMENNGPTVPGETSLQPARSVLNPRGPLLSSPLLPKIKRAIELNDSLTLRYVLNE